MFTPVGGGTRGNRLLKKSRSAARLSTRNRAEPRQKEGFALFFTAQGHTLERAGQHTKAVRPQRTGLLRITGAHILPGTCAQETVLADAPQGAGTFRQRHCGALAERVENAGCVGAGKHRGCRASLAFQAEAPQCLGCLTCRHGNHLPQHFLYFAPLPQGQGSLRPTRGVSRSNGSSPCTCPST